MMLMFTSRKFHNMFRVSDLEEYETQKVLSEFVDSAN
jgi:hypothetical protein